MTPDLFGQSPDLQPISPQRFARKREQRRSKIKSRAEWLAVSPKTLVARTRRTLASCRAQLVPMAAAWEDVDNSVQGQLDELLAAFDAYQRYVNESAEWLLEEPGT